MSKSKVVAEQICSAIGKKNITSFTNCMTRLRIKAKPGYDANKIKEIEGVLGLVKAGTDEIQIILGPGFVNKVSIEFQKIVDIEKDTFIGENINEFMSAKDVGKIEKNKIRGNGKIANFLAKISKVFTPLIPAFIGAGLLSGIAGIIASSVDNDFTGHPTLNSWNIVLSMMLTILTSVFIVAVAWRMGEEWGANPALCALIGAIFIPLVGSNVSSVFIPVTNNNVEGFNFLGVFIAAENITKNWFTVGFVNLGNDGVAKLGAAHAGLIGAMISVGVAINVEKMLRKFMPGAIDTIVTPIIVILIMIFVNYLLVVPVAGYLFVGVAFLFENLYTNPFGAAFLAGIFLFALAFGVHQGFLPIYFALIQETGVNGLFPILCMGGVAQVGVAMSLWVMAGKNSVLRKQISGAIIPGFLGIGEPLVYGISLPRIRPFVISCIAATVGGFYIGALNLWFNLGIGMNAATGPGGLTAAIMMTTDKGNVIIGVLVYLSAVILTYFTGAVFCFFGYSRIARHGSEMMKSIYSKKSITKLWIKIAYSIAFITIIGIFICWITWYCKLPNDKKTEIKNYRLV